MKRKKIPTDKLKVTLHKMASKNTIGEIPKIRVVTSRKYKKEKYKDNYENL